MSDFIRCPKCGIEVTAEEAVCPQCNTQINDDRSKEAAESKFPTLDENSGRITAPDGE